MQLDIIRFVKKLEQHMKIGAFIKRNFTLLYLEIHYIQIDAQCRVFPFQEI